MTAGFDPSFSEALAKRRPSAPSSEGHHRSTLTRPPCSKVLLGEVTLMGASREGSPSQNFTCPSAAPLISSGGAEEISKVKTAPVWPAKVRIAFRSFCSKDQQMRYPSLEQVKRCLLSADTHTLRIGRSWRHMKTGARLSSSCFFSRVCRLSCSLLLLRWMDWTVDAGSKAVMSCILSRTSESPGSFPARAVTSFSRPCFEVTLSS
mmetsp:Transcript_28915/g.68756  ORF Transcript_28915/g.68756 Transcript_28915/m.68756 type:complete len:206 (+) Transcript_28915:739-1356(+)